MREKLIPVLVTATLLCGGCESPTLRHGEIVVGDRDAKVRIVFSERDRLIIREWYDERRRALPPGLAKKGMRPPGHAKRWGPRDTLPPGLAWRELPPELERRLTRLPDDYIRIIVGSDIVLLDRRTRVILDILYDIALD